MVGEAAWLDLSGRGSRARGEAWQPWAGGSRTGEPARRARSPRPTGPPRVRAEGERPRGQPLLVAGMLCAGSAGERREPPWGGPSETTGSRAQPSEGRAGGSERQRRAEGGAGGRGSPPLQPEGPRPGRRLHFGGRRRARARCDATRRLRQPQPRRKRGAGAPLFRLIDERPSDRRSPGRNPGPQGAFEVSMINVSCNSH